MLSLTDSFWCLDIHYRRDGVLTNLTDRKMTAFVHLRSTEGRGLSCDFWLEINHTTKNLPLPLNLSSSYIWDLKGCRRDVGARETTITTTTTKRLKCINMRFLRGFVNAFCMDQDTLLLTTLFFLHSIFIPSVLVLHHEINDLPFDWSGVVFFVVCMFVSVCWYSWECQCMCKCSFTYVSGCLCLCMCVYSVYFCINESLCSEHCGGLRIPWWSSFLPFLT